MIRSILRAVPINVSSREKLFLTAGAGFVLVFFLFIFLIEPVFSQRAGLEEKIAEKRTELAEMQRMSREYRTLEAGMAKAEQRFSNRDEDFTLFSYMDRLAGETGIKDNISYMKPGSSADEASGLEISTVELKIQDVTLEQLASYLFHVETSESMVTVESLSVSREGGEDGLLSAVMKARTFEA